LNSRIVAASLTAPAGAVVFCREQKAAAPVNCWHRGNTASFVAYPVVQAFLSGMQIMSLVNRQYDEEYDRP
jgi:hypothetical protein